MPRIPRWKSEIEGVIKQKIREHFAQTAINDLIVIELQSEVRELLQITNLARTFNSVIKDNTFLPRASEPDLIPLRYQIVTRNNGYEIIRRSVIPETLPRNIFAIKLSEDFCLLVTMLQKPPVPSYV